MRRAAFLLVCALSVAVFPAAAGAQPPTVPPTVPPAPPVTLPSGAAPQAGAVPGLDAARQWHIERLSETHWKLTGDVEIEIEKDGTWLYADEVDYYTDTRMLMAKGNVKLATPTQSISADRAEFHRDTKLGTFFNASGTAKLGDTKPQSLYGTRENDIYFYGKTLEKIGDRKYRISDGGFTTCVQPRPRWEITSGTFILNIDHYALLTNSVMKVKGVPMLYLPIIYYPINKEDRNTGFLMPVYGTSTLRGHTISNAFFWAINRSHDATFLHDWFSNTGQGFGSEYRYIAGRSSAGDARFYTLQEKPTEVTGTDGKVTPVAGRKSYEVRSNVAQSLPFNLKGRARVDYFSEIRVQQTYNQNIYDASRRQRYYGGNLSGAWGVYTVSGSMDRSEIFFNSTDSTVAGNQPRLSFSRAERPIWRTPVYASVSGEYASMLRQTKTTTATTDLNMKRVDVTPTVRVAFPKWAFLNANTSLSWRYTRWNQSLDDKKVLVDVPVERKYFSLQTTITGPVFNRIWNPNNSYASKIKHTIEPGVTIQRVTAFDTYNNIYKLDGTDSAVGGSTRISYGLTNRVYAKSNQGDRQGQARQIFSLRVGQTYYSDERWSAVDSSYSSSYTAKLPSKYSSISFAASTAPIGTLSSDVRVEYDPHIDAIRSLSLTATYGLRDWISTSGGWSKQRFFKTAEPRTIDRQNQSITNQTDFKLLGGRLAGAVSFNYDVTKELFLQKRIMAYYNSQCCGVAVEYQVYDFSGYANAYQLAVQKDKRFNISITLSGVGTFSNFFGVFGGNKQ